MKISKDFARFIADLIGGTTPGHMAEVPNNPVLYSAVRAQGLYSFDPVHGARDEAYARFFIALGEALLPENEDNL